MASSPRPRPTRDAKELAKRREAIEKLKREKEDKKVARRGPSDDSREAIRKAAKEKIDAVKKQKEGPKRVDNTGYRKRPVPVDKTAKKPGQGTKYNPDDLKTTRQTPKTDEYIITERAENFYPNGVPNGGTYNGINPILIDKTTPQKQGPVVIPPDKPILIAGFEPQKQGPVSPMQMMPGMGQGRPSMAQPGPAQMANAQQLQARAQQLQARLNAARGQNRFR